MTIEARDGKGGITPAELQRDGQRDAADQCGAGGHLDAGDDGDGGPAYSYQATATDADGDAVQFVLVSGPNSFTIAPSGVVTWTPTAAQTGAQAVTIEARDGKGGITPQSFSVTVSATPPTNAAPVFTSTPGTTATVGAAVQLPGDGDRRGQRRGDVRPVERPPGFAIAPSGVVTWTPTAAQAGAQAVTIEARDGKGGVTPQASA